MNLGAWSVLSRQDPLVRVVLISLVLVALMALATALLGVTTQGLPGMDITVDPGGGLLPF